MIFDSMMRIGALGTLKVGSPVFNEYGTVLYMSATSKNLKRVTARPIPLTWSTGFLNQWLSTHPCKNDPQVPLWVNLRGRDKHKAMTYNTLRKTLMSITERSGVKKRIFFHLFRHMKITDMLLKGFPTQQIEYQEVRAMLKEIIDKPEWMIELPGGARPVFGNKPSREQDRCACHGG